MTTKNVFIALIFVLLISFQLKAQLLQESFNYPAGDSIGAHGWTHFSPTGAGVLNRISVTSPGLEYIDYQLPGNGNSTYAGSSGQDSYKPLLIIQNTGSVYAFFLIKADSVKTTGDYFCSFLPSTSATNFQGRVYMRKMITSSTNFSFGLSKTTIAGGIQWSDSIYTKGVTYLLVMKYTFNSVSNTDDQVSLFVFSSGVPFSEPAPTIGPLSGTGTDANDIGRFTMRQGSEAIAPCFFIDEIFIGNNWGGTLPVELSFFNSEINKRNVDLYWTTSAEINNSGFDIERKSTQEINGYPPNELTVDWKKIGFVKGNGTTDYSAEYSFKDRGLLTGNYRYRLKQIDFNGNCEYFNLENTISIEAPSKYNLFQNYPNPFNPSTTINYDLSVEGFVTLKVFDISGREIVTLINEFMTAGYHQIKFNASSFSEGFANGIYFYNLSVAGASGSNFNETKKMILLK